jgi:hypothetical protein
MTDVPLISGNLTVDAVNKAIVAVNNLTHDVATSESLADLTDTVVDYAEDNMMLGEDAGAAMDDGYSNVSLGKGTLQAATSAHDNTAVGDLALNADTTGSNNNALGSSALVANTTGGSNNATGVNALTANTTGSFNNAVGGGSLVLNTTGDDNTAVGHSAGATITTGTDNVLVGSGADVNSAAAANRIAIGAGAVCATDNTAQIGDENITDVTFGDGTAVLHGDGSALTNVSGSNVVRLATKAASTSASLDFTSAITTDYTHYICVLNDVLLSGTATLDIKTATDNATFTRNMHSQKEEITLDGTTAPTYTGVANSTPVPLTGTKTTVRITGRIEFDISTQIFLATATLTTNAADLVWKTTVVNALGALVNAFQLIPSSGTLTSGTAVLYGVKNT